VAEAAEEAAALGGYRVPTFGICGTMHMCVGVMAMARDPAAHESGRSLPMGRDDALDMLDVISHLCRQVDRMGPRGAG